MTLTTLKVTTDNKLSDLDLDNPLASRLTVLNGAVGGYIENVSFPIGAMYVNDEGLLNGLPINKIATHIMQAAYGADAGPIVGDVVFYGGVDAEGEEISIGDSFKKIIESVALNAEHW